MLPYERSSKKTIKPRSYNYSRIECSSWNRTNGYCSYKYSQSDSKSIETIPFICFGSSSIVYHPNQRKRIQQLYKYHLEGACINGNGCQWSSYDPHCYHTTDNSSNDLTYPVRYYLSPSEFTTRSQSQSNCWIEMSTRDVTTCVYKNRQW